MPIVARAFFYTAPDAPRGETIIKEAPLSCLIALCLTSLMCVALFFGVDVFEQLMASALLLPEPMLEGSPQ